MVKVVFTLAISFSLGLNVLAFESNVVISEIAWMGTEISSSDEWIELKNNTSDIINLEGWTLNAIDGSPVINLTGIMPANGYFLLERTDDDSVPGITADLIYTGSLENGGENLELRNDNGDLINSIESDGSWLVGDNTTKQTMEWSGNAWQSSINPGGTPKVSNSTGDIVQVEQAEDQEATSQASNTSSTSGSSDSSFGSSDPEPDSTKEDEIDLNYKNLKISEIYPNPSGSDLELEFIELYNVGTSAINLSGFKIGDSSKRVYKIKEKILGPKQYWILYRAITKIALNNTKDSVKLYLPGKTESFLSVDYNNAKEGLSYSLDQDIKAEVYTWSKIITPGKFNEIKEENLAPIAFFTISNNIKLAQPLLFDATDSYDPNGDDLTYFWDFGDGFVSRLDLTEHTFFKAGEYNVLLIVSDGEYENKITQKLIIKDSKENILPDKKVLEDNKKDLDIKESVESNYDLIISEIMPNPEGNDSEEWIEIYNNEEIDVNLKNWTIDDKDGGSKAYKFTDDFYIKAQDFLILGKEDTKLSLNNSFDQVRIFNPSGELVDKVEYSKAKEAQVYSFIQGAWHWTSEDTPGRDNFLEYYNYEFLNDYEEIDQVKDNKKNGVEEYIELPLSEVKNYEINSKIRTAGIVTAKPGVLGAQIFYIATNNAGLQIYNNKKDFPELSLGDYLVVQGVLASTNSELRLKTKIASDMKVIDNHSPFKPKIVNLSDVDNSLIARFVKVSGTVTERKANIIYLDDNKNEIEIYLKSSTGIKSKEIEEGMEYEVMGIVSKIKSGVKLIPRSINDFVLLDNNQIEEGLIFNIAQDQQDWALPIRDKKQEFFNYLLIISISTCAGLFFLLYKLDKN